MYCLEDVGSNHDEGRIRFEEKYKIMILYIKL
jgi:hypothetical protein